MMDLIFSAIDGVNAEAQDQWRIDKSPETPLLGDAGSLDSLTLVNLFVEIEQQIEDRTGKKVSLVDESTMTLDENPFHTIATLAAHLEKAIA